MRVSEKVRITEFCEVLNLEILHRGSEFIELSTVNINRPGLQLTGFFKHFGAERVQIMGELEFAYLKGLEDGARFKAVEAYFSHDMPCVIVSTELEPLPEILVCAEKHRRNLLRSKLRSTDIINLIVNYLNEILAPNETRHGVLIDLYGIGMLITGHSGIGKSETALELVQRGHRLVADDAVIIRRVNDRLIGTSPEIIRYFMEVRGIGIIDVHKMYGVGAVKLTKVIDIVVELENWNDSKEYDRLGLAKETIEILGHRLPKMTIPVRPGRNLAVILEVAARNQRLKSMGVSALDELNSRMAKGDN
ncbi:MAG: HPr(Ser) kinase/phosphatase [Clostridiales bacterium]|jgi:HPr kinase/phosphorylase|nr:HPr(Ser) kinase/phosphatase [Clostridiales bacterium]